MNRYGNPRALVGGALLLVCGAAWAWVYPPYGPYGPQPQGGYPMPPPQGAQPQGGYPMPPQGAPATPQGMPQAPQSGYLPPSGYAPGPQGVYPGGYPMQGQVPYQASPQGTPYQFRPRQPDNARGVPPAYPVPPSGYAPGYPQGYQGTWSGAQAPRRAAAPRLEWSLEGSQAELQPYVQQNLLLRLTLISAEGLTTADPDMPGGGDVLIQRLSGPDSTTRSVGDGRREVMTEFAMVLTPLRPGRLELPPFKITGTRPSAYGAAERYSAVASEPLRLQVRPAMSSVRPWLPLKSLTLNAVVDQPELVQPGQPVTLALEISALGADAAQLPNLEDQLKSPDFRVYREQTLTDSGLSKDGRQLVGKRTEYYTLVPQSGGNLRLPEIAVPWWNVDTASRQVATLPIRTLNIAGGSGPFGLSDSMASGSGWAWVWVPLGALLLVVAGYWGGVFYRRRGLGEGPGLMTRVRLGMAEALRRTGAQAGLALRRLHPGPVAARAQEAALGLLPQSSRFLRVVRHANQAQDPAAWCERFEQAARRHLRAAGCPRPPSMTEQMLDLRPRADRDKVTRLMEQLDAALYGRQDIDFPRWKRDFMRQIGRAPALLRRRRSPVTIRRASLPALNPRAA